jgi:hypothetical protein
VARFTETARSLFPDIAADPEAALDISEAMMMLHRRIERAVQRAEVLPPRSPAKPELKPGRWPFKRGP